MYICLMFKWSFALNGRENHQTALIVSVYSHFRDDKAISSGSQVGTQHSVEHPL